MNITPGQEMIEIHLTTATDETSYLTCGHCRDDLMAGDCGCPVETTLGELVNAVLLHAQGCANMPEKPIDL